VAQVVLRCDDERHWLRPAPRLLGYLFPRLPAQSQYNTRLRQLALLLSRERPPPASLRPADSSMALVLGSKRGASDGRCMAAAGDVRRLNWLCARPGRTRPDMTDKEQVQLLRLCNSALC
jgi:hypothetical protein